MAQEFKSFIYGTKEISALLYDASNFMWVAFKPNENNNCLLNKYSANNPLQRYYSIVLGSDEITRLTQDTSYIYLAVDDDTNIGYRYLKSAPLTSQVAITIPSGINEAPIDIAVGASNIFFLTPGLGGEIAKVIITNKAGTFQETVVLTSGGNDITNASGMTIDDNEDLWIVTNTAPVKLVRVYLDGTYQIQIDNVV